MSKEDKLSLRTTAIHEAEKDETLSREVMFNTTLFSKPQSSDFPKTSHFLNLVT